MRDVGTTGRWVRRGGHILVLPPGLGQRGGEEGEVAVTATRAGVIDGRIDVAAQHALLRMAKSADRATRTGAGEMLRAVKSGALAGIYQQNQEKAALRARALGTYWWKVMRPGENAVLLFHRAEAPLIAFRPALARAPAALDAALRQVWERFAALASPPVDDLPIRCELPPRPPDGVIMEASTCDPRSELLVPTCADIPDPCPASGIARAICEFKKRVANPRLVCHGQFYWTRLACEALRQLQNPVTPPFTPAFPSGQTLFELLTENYRKNGEPRTPDQMEQWFQRTYRRSVNEKDVRALDSVDADKCHDTVTAVVRLLRLAPTGPQCLGSLSRRELVTGNNGKQGEECALTYTSNLPAIVERMRATLDRGYVIRAGVVHPSPCGKVGHYLLIIGHDGGNEFVYWNTVQNETGALGRSFGIIEHAGGALRMKRGPHDVVSLAPLPAGAFTHRC